mmetsp:Transcript_26342/g.38795  ORF Transcript_26342/g.38795 Transcript_26342/m.38795 type:complete len:97 (-) Transcript_26342:1065-1355(-)
MHTIWPQVQKKMFSYILILLHLLKVYTFLLNTACKTVWHKTRNVHLKEKMLDSQETHNFNESSTSETLVKIKNNNSIDHRTIRGESPQLIREVGTF